MKNAMMAPVGAVVTNLAVAEDDGVADLGFCGLDQDWRGRIYF